MIGCLPTAKREHSFPESLHIITEKLASVCAAKDFIGALLIDTQFSLHIMSKDAISMHQYETTGKM